MFCETCEAQVPTEYKVGVFAVEMDGEEPVEIRSADAQICKVCGTAHLFGWAKQATMDKSNEGFKPLIAKLRSSPNAVVINYWPKKVTVQ